MELDEEPEEDLVGWLDEPVEVLEDLVEGVEEVLRLVLLLVVLRRVVLVVPLGVVVRMRVLDEPEERTLLLTVV